VPRRPRNAGKQWTDEQEGRLDELIDENTPTRLIAWKLGRSVDSIYSKVQDLDLLLKPTNQSPYNLRKR
jgi:hypothetical protein